MAMRLPMTLGSCRNLIYIAIEERCPSRCVAERGIGHSMVPGPSMKPKHLPLDGGRSCVFLSALQSGRESKAFVKNRLVKFAI